MQIREAATNEDLDAAGLLFREYAAWLRIDLCFQGFEQELANLPGIYANPCGRLILAWADKEPSGCVALRPLSDTTCEMKRLFVRPAFRGQNLGRRLVERVISDARDIGYTCMVLDTLPFMHSALRLYDEVGFVQRSAYYDTPLPETIFMELRLLPERR